MLLRVPARVPIGGGTPGTESRHFPGGLCRTGKATSTSCIRVTMPLCRSIGAKRCLARYRSRCARCAGVWKSWSSATGKYWIVSRPVGTGRNRMRKKNPPIPPTRTSRESDARAHRVSSGAIGEHLLVSQDMMIVLCEPVGFVPDVLQQSQGG